MQKSAPSLGRLAAMVIFALSVFGLLTFLWVSFGGPVPLKAKAYQLKVNFPEAATLAEQADVRVSGVNVGKVQSMQLDRGAARETATLNIDPKYAPLPVDTRAILRQKTLLGETYVELTPGSGRGAKLKDGSQLSNAQVEPTVTLDQILRIFDPKTREAFRGWLASAAQTFRGSSPMDLNDALGNLAGFAQSGADVLNVLNTQQAALRDVIHKTGVVFGAINQRTGQLRQLIVNSSNTFSALSSEQAALAQTFDVFPTYLDESRTTLARLERFAGNTRPLVLALTPVADKLSPTFQDLGALAPDLKNVFIRLKPVIRVSTRDLHAGSRFLRGAPPVLKGLTVFLPEFNPVLGYLNYSQDMVAHFLADGANATNYKLFPTGDGNPHDLLGFWGVIGSKSFMFSKTQPTWERSSAYQFPAYWPRGSNIGIQEELSCRNTASGGEQRIQNATSTDPGSPPCFVAPPQLDSGRQYTFLQRGQVFKGAPAKGYAGNPPANYFRALRIPSP